MLYACIRSIERLQLLQEYSPGSLVPGPPRIPIIMRPPSGGGAGLMEATSKVGLGACPYAVRHAKPVSIIRAIFISVLLSSRWELFPHDPPRWSRSALSSVPA